MCGDKMDSEKIGKFINENRKRLNLTQKELADMLLVTSQAVSKWENGRGIPDIEMLGRLSEIFNVDINEIINGEFSTKKDKPQLHNNKNRIYILILVIILLISIILLIVLNGNNEEFKFNSLTSNNSCFGVKGVIAYNKNKKSIYISDIQCTDEQVSKYLDIECILYEQVGQIDKKIYEYGKIKDNNSYDLNNAKTLNELLNDVVFNVDDYDCSCDKLDCNNLYIRLNALNTSYEVITYNIKVELEKNCVS